MKAILIDDEWLALRDLERQLDRVGGIAVLATFQDAAEAIARLPELRPDVVFLDIEMPELSGIEAAEMIQSLPDAPQVVFVTAYEEYAVKAFEFQALDYVLKPVQTERLTRTVQRLQQLHAEKPDPSLPRAAATVRCFQKLHIEHGKAGPFYWRTIRAQELFAYLVYKRAQPVRKDVLLDFFWPNTDHKKGYTQMYTTIYQIRKSLEAAGLDIRLTNSGTDYYLDLGSCKYDIEEWEYEKEGLPPLTPETVDLHRLWLDKYEGHYLAENGYVWAANESQRLRSIWYQQAQAIARLLRQVGRSAEALQLYADIEKLHPFTEEVYFAFMQLHGEAGKPLLVREKYARLCEMLKDEYGTSPSAAVLAWMTEYERHELSGLRN